MTTDDQIDLGPAPDDPPALRMLLPDGWDEIPLDADDLDETIRTLAQGLLDDASMGAAAQPVVLALRASLERARSEGAVAMVAYNELFDGDTAPTAASLVVYVRRLRDPLADMVHQFDTTRKQVDVLDLGTDRTYVRVTEQIEALIDVLDTTVQVHSVRYYQEIEGTPYTAILVYTTPNIPLADDFTELFDELTSTFEIEIPPATGGEDVPGTEPVS